MKGSETSSELDFSSHVSENRPVANSTFNSSSQHVDLESSSAENEDQESLHAKVINFYFQLYDCVKIIMCSKQF